MVTAPPYQDLSPLINTGNLRRAYGCGFQSWFDLASFMGNLLRVFIAGEFMKATLLRVLVRLVSIMHAAYPRLLDLAILARRQQLIALRRTTVIEATFVAGRICLGSGHGSC